MRSGSLEIVTAVMLMIAEVFQAIAGMVAVAEDEVYRVEVALARYREQAGNR